MPGASTPEGIGLCLSGGGYRAMLFHLGGLVRLNQLGMLRGLAVCRVSPVGPSRPAFWAFAGLR